MTRSNLDSDQPAQNGDSRDAWIEELQNRLLHLERLASVGELTSTTTHEFNNLLMTVINYARMGLNNKDDAAREKAFSRILDAANRGAKITSMVLGLARNRSGEMEPLIKFNACSLTSLPMLGKRSAKMVRSKSRLPTKPLRNQ